MCILSVSVKPDTFLLLLTCAGLLETVFISFPFFVPIHFVFFPKRMINFLYSYCSGSVKVQSKAFAWSVLIYNVYLCYTFLNCECGITATAFIACELLVEQASTECVRARTIEHRYSPVIPVPYSCSLSHRFQLICVCFGSDGQISVCVLTLRC